MGFFDDIQLPELPSSSPRLDVDTPPTIAPDVNAGLSFDPMRSSLSRKSKQARLAHAESFMDEMQGHLGEGKAGRIAGRYDLDTEQGKQAADKAFQSAFDNYLRTKVDTDPDMTPEDKEDMRTGGYHKALSDYMGSRSGTRNWFGQAGQSFTDTMRLLSRTSARVGDALGGDGQTSQDYQGDEFFRKQVQDARAGELGTAGTITASLAGSLVAPESVALFAAKPALMSRAALESAKAAKASKVAFQAAQTGAKAENIAELVNAATKAEQAAQAANTSLRVKAAEGIGRTINKIETPIASQVAKIPGLGRDIVAGGKATRALTLPGKVVTAGATGALLDAPLNAAFGAARGYADEDGDIAGGMVREVTNPLNIAIGMAAGGLFDGLLSRVDPLSAAQQFKAKDLISDNAGFLTQAKAQKKEMLDKFNASLKEFEIGTAGAKGQALTDRITGLRDSATKLKNDLDGIGGQKELAEFNAKLKAMGDDFEAFLGKEAKPDELTPFESPVDPLTAEELNTSGKGALFEASHNIREDLSVAQKDGLELTKQVHETMDQALNGNSGLTYMDRLGLLNQAKRQIVAAHKAGKNIEELGKQFNEVLSGLNTVYGTKMDTAGPMELANALNKIRERALYMKAAPVVKEGTPPSPGPYPNVAEREQMLRDQAFENTQILKHPTPPKPPAPPTPPGPVPPKPPGPGDAGIPDSPAFVDNTPGPKPILGRDTHGPALDKNFAQKTVKWLQNASFPLLGTQGATLNMYAEKMAHKMEEVAFLIHEGKTHAINSLRANLATVHNIEKQKPGDPVWAELRSTLNLQRNGIPGVTKGHVGVGKWAQDMKAKYKDRNDVDAWVDAVYDSYKREYAIRLLENAHGAGPQARHDMDAKQFFLARHGKDIAKLQEKIDAAKAAGKMDQVKELTQHYNDLVAVNNTLYNNRFAEVKKLVNSGLDDKVKFSRIIADDKQLEAFSSPYVNARNSAPLEPGGVFNPYAKELLGYMNEAAARTNPGNPKVYTDLADPTITDEMFSDAKSRLMNSWTEKGLTDMTVDGKLVNYADSVRITDAEVLQRAINEGVYIDPVDAPLKAVEDAFNRMHHSEMLRTMLPGKWEAAVATYGKNVAEEMQVAKADMGNALASRYARQGDAAAKKIVSRSLTNFINNQLLPRPVASKFLNANQWLAAIMTNDPASWALQVSDLAMSALLTGPRHSLHGFQEVISNIRSGKAKGAAGIHDRLNLEAAIRDFDYGAKGPISKKALATITAGMRYINALVGTMHEASTLSYYREALKREKDNAKRIRLENGIKRIMDDQTAIRVIQNIASGGELTMESKAFLASEMNKLQPTTQMSLHYLDQKNKKLGRLWLSLRRFMLNRLATTSTFLLKDALENSVTGNANAAMHGYKNFLGMVTVVGAVEYLLYNAVRPATPGYWTKGDEERREKTTRAMAIVNAALNGMGLQIDAVRAAKEPEQAFVSSILPIPLRSLGSHLNTEKKQLFRGNRKDTELERAQGSALADMVPLGGQVYSAWGVQRPFRDRQNKGKPVGGLDSFRKELYRGFDQLNPFSDYRPKKDRPQSH